jgi:hypothetical protein
MFSGGPRENSVGLEWVACGIAVTDCNATKQAYKLNAAMLAAPVPVRTPA